MWKFKIEILYILSYFTCMKGYIYNPTAAHSIEFQSSRKDYSTDVKSDSHESFPGKNPESFLFEEQTDAKDLPNISTSHVTKLTTFTEDSPNTANIFLQLLSQANKRQIVRQLFEREKRSLKSSSVEQARGRGKPLRDISIIIPALSDAFCALCGKEGYAPCIKRLCLKSVETLIA